MSEPHIVGVVGSLREESYTRVGIERALVAAEELGATTELLDLQEFDLPVFDADHREVGDAVEFADRVHAADSILLGTPVYHGSYSGVLKNALDYCGFDEFEHKTVGLLAVAGGGFPITALEHLRSVCRALNCWVIPHQAAVPNAHNHIADGQIVDADIEERVTSLGEEAVKYANIEPDSACFESTENVGADD
ncbi:NAD(P)H-dependent oxidoreductase [Haloarcula hispanica]|uniref:NAD(P)H-dependent oxidoreductase n=1 Tax=Haloarcula hispanica TaxID=51589 RepID=A0A482T903_HALHI|nr:MULTISPECIES: NADPH-dependent FMN reductase [Haloarcula]AJF27136.1 FMN reductase [Haloarcula sp. CBA1115]KAA9407068.1 NAD(P)H-dependent oxidoreductase [Haloarcula sp. CBA1131]KAA9409897.1 NAD(P)H-dependent oxidoreductase [Haloarcula hispanica]KZX48681.1 FMN reductase [Haloarcula sp. K1]MCJ0618925.1 NAD(P)H-dependent oxidoreductase [Haloarcula hispanica]